MKRLTVGLTLLAVLSACPGRAFALGGEHPKGKLGLVHADWPEGFLDLINIDARVHGHWVNANDEFFFQADTSTLNRFLTACEKLKGTPLKVVLHAGSARRSDLWGKKPVIPYDWKLLVMRRGWGAPADPKRPKDDPGYVVTVDVWLDNEIKLEKLEVPRTVRVESGGEIERFIRERASRANESTSGDSRVSSPQ